MRLVPLAALALVGGCFVDRPALDEGFFPCREPTDCVDGFACAEGNVYSEDFCRPEVVNGACRDGQVATVDGACLDACALFADGTTSACDEGFSCVRTDAVRDTGVCFPVEGCSTSDDCGEENEVCLNQRFGLFPLANALSISFDRVYCTARPEGGRCADGYLLSLFPPSCFPPCRLGEDRLACPPGLACVPEVTFGDNSVCSPGIWGSRCEDDTQCLLGRCLSVRADDPSIRACTETVDELRAQFPQARDCSFLNIAAGIDPGGVGALRFLTATIDGEATCVPRYEPLEQCVGGFGCADVEASCQPIPSIDGAGGPPRCQLACDTSFECASIVDRAGEQRDFCAGELGCIPLKDNGATCLDAINCFSLFCASGRCRSCRNTEDCDGNACNDGRCVPAT